MPTGATEEHIPPSHEAYFLSTGPLPIGVLNGSGAEESQERRDDASKGLHRGGPGKGTEDSVVLLSDYSLMRVEVAVEHGAYISGQLMADKRAKRVGPKVQVFLCVAASNLVTDSDDYGCSGVRGDKDADGEVIHTTAPALCVTQPNWGEKCSLSLAWATCKRAALRFRVLPAVSG